MTHRPALAPGRAQMPTIDDRALRALQLSDQGLTYQQVGDAMGFSRETAKRLISRAVGTRHLEYEEVRKSLQERQFARLETWMAAIYPNTQEGDLDAINVGLRIIERENKLFGLDEAAETNLNVRIAATIGPQLDQALEVASAATLADRAAAAELGPAITASTSFARPDVIEVGPATSTATLNGHTHNGDRADTTPS